MTKDQRCNCGANPGEGHLITCPQSPANRPSKQGVTWCTHTPSCAELEACRAWLVARGDSLAGSGDMILMVDELLQRRRADETSGGIDEGKLWSFLRDVMTTGCAIETDTRARGRRYEEHSARLDAAARDAIPQFFQRLGLLEKPSDYTKVPEVMNPPASAAQGAEARNLTRANVMGLGEVHRATEARPAEVAPLPCSPLEPSRELSPSEAASFDKTLARSPRRIERQRYSWATTGMVRDPEGSWMLRSENGGGDDDA